MSKSDRVPLPPLNVICDHLSLIDVDLSLPDDERGVLGYSDIIRLLRGGSLYDKTILIRNHLLTIGVDTSDVDTVRAIKSMLSKPTPQEAARMIALLNPTKFSIVDEEDE